MTYPNPSDGNFELIIPFNDYNAEISIFNLKGKKVLYLRQETANKNSAINVKLGNVPDGKYVLEYDSEKASKKIVLTLKR